MKNIIKTAESVAIGHPDKICDQISDAILDEYLRQDPNSRVAIETMGGHGRIYIVGEITSQAKVDYPKIALKVYQDCGYSDQIEINCSISQQSSEISQGVDKGGAGDQGIMIGYACNETLEFMPSEVILARKLTRAMGKRDGKSQVTLKNGKIIKIVTSVCGDYPLELIKELEEMGIKWGDKRWFKNPSGDWSIGGFRADTGLTGRKIIVDNYGPNVAVGGGCFSGKDPTKVDRSGAYMARRIAVDLLKKWQAEKVLVRLAYVIGVAEPVMATAEIEKNKKLKIINRINDYNLTPQGIIEFLDLKKPIYLETSRHGHFGNNFKWDR